MDKPTDASPVRKHEDAVVIQLPNLLALKIGPGFNKLNPIALAKAEAALKGLQALGTGWINFEIDNLSSAYAALKTSGPCDLNFAKFAVPALELRTHAAVYEYPIVARIAGSLCALLNCEERASAQALRLFDAHIEAIKACVKKEIRELDHAFGKALADTLEQQVRLIN